MKSTKVKKEGYSMGEARGIVNEAIDQSIKHLRRRLRVVWKKQEDQARQGSRYGATV